jgi:hypothetical protein
MQINFIRIKQLIYLILVLFFLLLFLRKVIPLQMDFSDYGWRSGDWLINYSQGFIRRGLFGELSLKIYENLGIEPLLSIYFFKIFCYVVFCSLILFLCLKRKLGVFELVLIASPWALLFELYEPGGSGRKEILLFAVYMIFISLKDRYPYEKKKTFQQWSFWFLICALPIMVLMHEGLFFFYLFIPLFMLLRGESYKDISSQFLLPFFISFIIFLGLYLFFLGNKDIGLQICQSVEKFNQNGQIKCDPFLILESKEYVIHSGFYKTFIPLFSLMLAPLFFYARVALAPSTFKKIIRFCPFVILFTFVLYAVAIDWGRWIHITGVLLFICILANKSSYNVTLIRSLSSYLIAGVFIVFYIFYWKLPLTIGSKKIFSWGENSFFNAVSTIF